MGAVQRLADARNWRLVPIIKTGCPIADVRLWNAERQRESTACRVWLPRALAMVESERPSIIFVGVSRGYDVLSPEGPVPLLQASGQWQDGMARTLARLKSTAGSLVLFADTPRHSRSPLTCLARASSIEECETSRSALVSRPYARLERQLAAETGSLLIDATDWLCTNEDCPLVMGDWFVYRDASHLAVSFASDVLAPQLAWEIDHRLGLASP
jgi:hypothetical protein